MKKLLFTILLFCSCVLNVTARELASPPTAVAITLKNRALAGITAMQTYYANIPERTGTNYHYCDCGTGAEGDCVVGDDNTGDGSSGNPYRTISAAMTRLNSLSTGQTVSLCKGGAFNPSGSLSYTNSSCTAGTAGSPRYCFDFRDYSPSTFTGTAKPRINEPAGSAEGAWFFKLESNVASGGLRVMNLHFQGLGVGVTTAGAIYTYNGNTSKHDVLIANNTIDGWGGCIVDNHTDTREATNIWWNANTLSECAQGIYGSSEGGQANFNHITSSGGIDNREHPIYISAGALSAANMQVVGNYIWGQRSDTATQLSAIIVVHGVFTDLLISKNYLGTDEPAAGGWGISVYQGYIPAESFTDTIISNNTIVNGGNAAITLSNCIDCIIENNLVLGLTSIASVAIEAPHATAWALHAINTGTTIRNNTVYYSTAVTGSKTGIRVGLEGTGYTITNNTIYNAATTGALYCFDYDAALTDYIEADNNNCYSASTYVWEANHGSTLASWRTYATTYGFDSASSYSNPNFTDVSVYNFKPTGNPLTGAGNNTHKSVKDAVGATRPNPPAIGALE